MPKSMPSIFTALACGIIFGLGLSISGMTNPAKIISFADITGQWDPSLALVMLSAIAVYATGFKFSQKGEKPVFALKFHIPTRSDIDARLMAGSVLFGVGWGLGGICPGPSITALTFGMEKFYIFFAAMAAGLVIFRFTMERRDAGPEPQPAG